MTVTIRLRMVLCALTAAAIVALALLVVLDAMRANAAPGDTDTTYVPTPGCRLADTRPGTDRIGQHAAALGTDSYYTFQVRGSNGNCTGPLAIPSHATGVALNVTAVAPTANSNLRVYPANTDVPLLSNLNVTAGASPIPNKVDVQLSPSGAIRVYNTQGSVHIILDLLGYYTNSSLTEIGTRLSALETQIAELQSANANLEGKLANVSIVEVDGRKTIRFHNVNVQIVDGSGDTPCGVSGSEACDGRGNLILGYHENTNFGSLATRSGSHNFVTGTENDYTSYSGIIAGNDNTASGEFATITGGSGNVASGDYSSVSGGVGNTASGDNSSITGGVTSVASGRNSSISGGEASTASGNGSWVGGGANNSAEGVLSAVGGGDGITASGPYEWNAG